MTLAERDAYILGLLTRVKAQGLSGQQAANEVARLAGSSFIELPGLDSAAVVADVAALQTAVTALTVPATRTAASAHPALTGGIKMHSTPPGLSTSTAAQLRVLAAGG